MALRAGVLHGLALCAGGGGLELGLHLAIGERYRTVGMVERDAYAAACLVARMEDAVLDPAPLWDDITTFDGRAWRGVVDIVSAGFPCQPFSVAGKRRGIKDDRWLWPDVARVIRDVGPRFVFLENVPGLVRHGLDRVVGDLAELGFAAEWDGFSASDVGAPHLRKRLFLLADAGCGAMGGDDKRAGWETGIGAPSGNVAYAERHKGIQRREPDLFGRWQSPTQLVGLGGERMADTGDGLLPVTRRRSEGGNGSGSASETLADADDQREPQPAWSLGDERRWTGNCREGGVGLADTDRHGGSEGRTTSVLQPRREPESPRLPLFPPGPGDADGWRQLIAIDPRLEPAIRGDADGLVAGMERRRTPHRAERLRVLGNGVVPLVAAVAFVTLAERLGVVIDD